MASKSNAEWIKKIAKYKERCNSILKISKSIRYVSVLNDYGKTMTGVMRPGLKPMLSRDNALNEFFMLSTMVSLRKESMNHIGSLDHYVLYHKKVVQILIPKGDNILYFSVGPRTQNIDELVSKVKKMI